MTETGAEKIVLEHDSAQMADLYHAIEAALSDNEAARVKALVEPLRAPDLAEIITLLSPEERIALVKALGDELDYEMLSELDETVRDQLVEVLPNEQLADAMRELDTDDALYVIEDMDEADKDEILARLPQSDRVALKRGFEYPEDSAGRLMQSDFIAVPPFWSVGQTIDFMRETEDLPDTFSQIYVVDPSFHLHGIVKLGSRLWSSRCALRILLKSLRCLVQKSASLWLRRLGMNSTMKCCRNLMKLSEISLSRFCPTNSLPMPCASSTPMTLFMSLRIWMRPTRMKSWRGYPNPTAWR